MCQLVSSLLVTDMVRSRRLDVFDEIRNGIYFLTTTIWDIVPGLQAIWQGDREGLGGGSARVPELSHMDRGRPRR